MEDISSALHPRDKGWAWVIMMGSFCVNAVLVGYIRSFGLLFVAIQEQYGYSSGLTSVVVGVQNVCFCLVTVFVMTVFIKKNSVRTSCIIGILLQTLAVSLCNLVQNAVFLIACLGLLFGIGQGFLHFPSQYMVPIYFQKRQSSAVVFATCGASIGGMIFPIITESLLDFYGLQGALLMIAGILLNQLIFVIIYTPPSEYRLTDKSKISVDGGSQMLQLQKRLLKSDAEERNADSELEIRVQKDSDDGFSEHKYSISETTGKELLQQDRQCDVDTPAEMNFQKKSMRSDTAIQRDETYERHCCMESIFCTKHCFHDKTRHREKDHRGLEDRGSNPEVNGRNDKLQSCRECIPEVFYSRMFWVLLIYFFGCSVGSGCAALFIPPLAVERGLSNDTGAFFLTLSAVMDIVGRLITGFILQMELMTPSVLALVPQAIGCITFSLTFVLQDYTGILILSIVFGLISSSFFATRALLVIEVLGMGHLASASGYYGLVTGFAMGISYPIGGFLHDATGTYSSSFVYLAACFLLGILSLVAVQILKRRNI